MIDTVEGYIIDREELIDLIEKCVAEIIWKREECITIFSSEDEYTIETIIDESIT